MCINVEELDSELVAVVVPLASLLVVVVVLVERVLDDALGLVGGEEGGSASALLST